MKKRIFSSFLSLVLVLSLLPWSAMAADEQVLSAEENQVEERQEQDPGVPVTLPADPETALPVVITLDPQEDEQDQQEPEQEPDQAPADQPQEDENDFQAPPQEAEIPSEEEQAPETPEEPEVLFQAQTQATPVALAEEHKHFLCASDACTHVGGHEEEQKTVFQPWDSNNSLPASGTYYLTEDVTLNGTYTVNSDLTICLNGFDIICTEGSGNGWDNHIPTIQVENESTFTLTDCHSGTEAGKITHTSDKYGYGVYNYGTFNMYGGTIAGNNDSGVANYTSWRFSTAAIFNMYGGAITNNTDSYGSGVKNDSYSDTMPTVVNLYGGSITDNKGGYRGGGVANSGGSIVNMSGNFVIAGNEVTDRGGGVYNCMSTFNMNGGIIGGTNADDANKAESDLGYGGAGGGVSNWGGTFNMNGGTIIGNSSKEGGGVSNSPYFNDVKATFNMNGGKITGNEALYGGGVASTGNAAYDGKPAISSDFSVGGTASITDNNGKFGGGVYLGDSAMVVSGSANITHNENNGTISSVYLSDGKTMTVDNGFNGTIGVTAAKPADDLVIATGTALTADIAAKFQSDNSDYSVKLSDENLVLSAGGSDPKPISHTHDLCGTTHHAVGDHTTASNVTFEPWDSDNALPTSGTYYLTKDVTLSGTHVVNGRLTLCLNGHTITGANISSGSGVIQVNTDNGNFTLTDCKDSGAVTVSGQEFRYGVSVAGGDAKAATFTLYNGTISAPENGCDGVTVNRGTFIMNGGTVSSPVDSDMKTTTGVYVGYDGKFVMNGGTISNNRGQGVYVVGNSSGGGRGSFTMNGGLITGNYKNGVLVMCDNTFTMNGGTISNNALSYVTYCGVKLGSTTTKDRPGHLVMTGGEIVNNKGAGVRIGTAGLTGISSFTMSGGTISGNIAYGGVDLISGHTFTVSGTPNITGNGGSTTTNVNLRSDTTITVDGKLGDTAKIGVTAEDAAVGTIVAEPGAGVILTDTDAAKFTSDDTNYSVILKNGNLVLGEKSSDPQPGTKTDVSGKITFPNGELTYTGSGLTYEKATISGDYTGKFTYKYDIPKGGSSGKLDANGLPVDVGDYTVTATYEDDNNIGTAHASLTVKAASDDNSSSGSDRSDSGSSTPTYPITTPGSVNSSKKSAAKGDTVTITVKPDAGYVVKEVLVTDTKGNQIKVTAKGTNVFTFVQPDSPVDVQAIYTWETAPFQDVVWNDYFYDAVKWAKDHNITGGVGDNLFGSDQACTRAQIVTFLWRAAGSPEPKGTSKFSDVPADAYYAKAVAWAVENGITSGTGADRFSPDAACTRAQSITFLYRLAGSPAVTGSADFRDVAGSDYFAAAVAWAKANDITDGVGNGLFGFMNSCTRTQIVTFLYRVFGEQ